VEDAAPPADELSVIRYMFGRVLGRGRVDVLVGGTGEEVYGKLDAWAKTGGDKMGDDGGGDCAKRGFMETVQMQQGVQSSGIGLGHKKGGEMARGVE